MVAISCGRAKFFVSSLWATAAMGALAIALTLTASNAPARLAVLCAARPDCDEVNLEREAPTALNASMTIPPTCAANFELGRFA